MPNKSTEIVITVSARGEEVRRFGNLADAREFAQKKVGTIPVFDAGWAVSRQGSPALKVDGCTRGDLFPNAGKNTRISISYAPHGAAMPKPIIFTKASEAATYARDKVGDYPSLRDNTASDGRGAVTVTGCGVRELFIENEEPGEHGWQSSFTSPSDPVEPLRDYSQPKPKAPPVD